MKMLLIHLKYIFFWYFMSLQRRDGWLAAWGRVHPDCNPYESRISTQSFVAWGTGWNDGAVMKIASDQRLLDRNRDNSARRGLTGGGHS